MTIADDVKRLREMLAALPPAPWVTDDGNVFSKPMSDERSNACMRRMNGEKIPHPDDGLSQPYGFVCTTTQETPYFQEVEEWIAASRNLLPGILNELDRLRSALKGES